MDYNKLSEKDLDIAIKVAEMAERTKSKVTDAQLEIAFKVAHEAERQGINPNFVLPIMMAESNFNPDARSKKDAFGVAQLTEATAKSLKVDRYDLDDNIRGGILLIKDLMKDPNIGADPARILVGYNTSSDTRNKYFASQDLNDLPEETQNYILKIGDLSGGEKLPPPVLTAKEAEPEKTGLSLNEGQGTELRDADTPPSELPRSIAGLAGGVGGASTGATAAAAAAKYTSKLDLVEKLAQNFPEVLSDLKSGKAPMDVVTDLMAAKSTGSNLPPAQGPLTGEPAGGRMTQNWVASQDAEGRYTDVGLKARDQAEAHQMKRAAMAAEDKIRQIAPEMRADPTRANLLIPQSAGRGPSPRFGGTPSVPVAPVAPVAENPTLLGNLAKMASHYTPYLKWPVAGAFTGANVGQGAADVYNRVQANKPAQAAASALGTAASTVAPFVGTAASIPLTGLGALIPAALYMQDNPEVKKEFVEQGLHGKTPYGRTGFNMYR